MVDAKNFLPQSRERVFLIGIRKDMPITGIEGTKASWPHSDALVAAHSRLSDAAKATWVWWNLPLPPPRNTTFADIIEDRPTNVVWHTEAETAHLIALMQPTHVQKVEEAKRAGKRMVGGLYRRTRVVNGKKRQCAEVRFDDVAGCLRVPTGGSSRQTVLIVDGDRVRSRLLSPREAARLMGLDDSYKLPSNYNDGYSVCGDGVAVPVVRYVSEQILIPVLEAAAEDRRRMAS